MTLGKSIIGGIAAVVAWMVQDTILAWIEKSAFQDQMEAENP